MLLMSPKRSLGERAVRGVDRGVDRGVLAENGRGLSKLALLSEGKKADLLVLKVLGSSSEDRLSGISSTKSSE